MWVWPQVPLGGPSPSAPLRYGTPPPHQPGLPPPSALQKEPGAMGGRGRGWGGKGCGLREGSSSYNEGTGGTLKGWVGPDPHLGALEISFVVLLNFSLLSSFGRLARLFFPVCSLFSLFTFLLSLLFVLSPLCFEKAQFFKPSL